MVLKVILFLVFGIALVVSLTGWLSNRFQSSSDQSATRPPQAVIVEGRTPAPCPRQDSTVGVVLVIGQSNAANYAEKLFKTKYPSAVLNYFSGMCYAAESPLLGASGTEGEFITPLADRLIQNETYDSVVIVAAAVGGSRIADWGAAGSINRSLVETIGQMTTYQITDVVWHQGEADFTARTSTLDYERDFKSLQRSLTKAGVNAPIFISVATKCGYDEIWVQDNQIVVAQRHLVDNVRVFLAADTDDILIAGDRRSDECHLAQSGQLKVANAYADAIHAYHRTR